MEAAFKLLKLAELAAQADTRWHQTLDVLTEVSHSEPNEERLYKIAVVAILGFHSDMRNQIDEFLAQCEPDRVARAKASRLN